MAAPEEAEAKAGRLQAAEQGSANTGATEAGEGVKGDSEADKGDDLQNQTPLTKEQAVMLYSLRSRQTCGEDQVRCSLCAAAAQHGHENTDTTLTVPLTALRLCESLETSKNSARRAVT
jgi:hypothetical protein